MKKLLSFIVILSFLLTLASCGGEEEKAKSETEKDPSKGLEFTSNGDGTCYVSGLGECTDADVVIPSKSPDGDKVTGIGRSAFSYSERLISVTIPSSVTSIGEDAFNNCSLLMEITVDKGNKVYHSSGNCLIETATKTLILGCQYSVIPDDGSVTSIGEGAFQYCYRLTDITIPSSVTSIGAGAFRDCNSLRSITIPMGVTSIGGSAFGCCFGLTKVTIPSSVTSIGSFAFSSCTELRSISFTGTYDQWVSIEKDDTWNSGIKDCDFHFSDEEQTSGSGQTTESGKEPSEGLRFTSNGDGTCYVSGIGNCSDVYVVIPSESPDGDKVTGIGEGALKSCRDLTDISIPSSVTSIGKKAFAFCDGIINVTMSSSVTIIDEYAFSYCYALKNVTLSSDLTSIGESAFEDCQSLMSIEIPSNVTSIGINAFLRCEGLTSITVDKSNKVYHSSGNCLIETATKTLILGCDDSVIPTDGSVTSIGYRAFKNCDKLRSVTIPSDVTSIGNSAFSYCSRLTEVTIPSKVTSIEGSTFSFCSALTSITIPSNVTSIGERAFMCCGSLASITIPSSVTSIGEGALTDCNDLTSINYQGTKAQWEDVEKGEAWDGHSKSYTVHCTDGDITK